MSWLSGLIDRNRNAVGNLVKNVSPLLALTPLGMAGSFVGGALGRGMQKGANIGSMLKSGASNAAIGGGANALKSAFIPSSAAGSAPAYGVGMGTPTSGINPVDPNAWLANGAVESTPQAGLMSKVTDALGSGVHKAVGFAKDNPNAVGMGLQGLGAISGAQAQNKQADREYALGNRRMALEEEAAAKKRQQDQALEAQRQAVLAALMKSFGTGGF